MTCSEEISLCIKKAVMSPKQGIWSTMLVEETPFVSETSYEYVK